MKLAELIRLSVFFSRIARDPDSRRAHPEVEESNLETRDGYRYDLYRPRRPSLGLVVAVHGVTLLGNRDSRLIHFARCLARTRIACATPVLPGLASCRWRAEDVDALIATTLAAAEAAGCAPGLLGFSFGGGVALVAASRPALADRLRFVVSFGAHHDLNQLFDGYLADAARRPASATEWDDWIYLRLVLADQHGAEAGLDEEVRAQARALLARYCHDATAEEKRRFHDQHLDGLDLCGLGSRLRDRAALDALSPAGKLGSLRAPVSLIHDREDTTVPLVHGERLQREVAAAVGEGRCRFLPTSLLAHVSLGDVFKLGEVRRLYAALAPLAEW